MIKQTVRIEVSYDEADIIRILDKSSKWRKSCNGTCYVYERPQQLTVNCEMCKYQRHKGEIDYCMFFGPSNPLGENGESCTLGRLKNSEK